MAKMFMGDPGGGASIDGAAPVPCEIKVEQEWIDVSSGLPTRKPDMSWELVDKKGHFHAFTEDGKLPTLDEEKVRRPCPGGCGDPGCDGTVFTRYRCRICKKKIQPGWISSYDNLNAKMPGLKTWSVEVVDGPLLVMYGRVSVKVTAGGRTYFGIGYPGNPTFSSDGSSVSTRYTVHGEGELGRRVAPAEPGGKAT